MGLASFNAMRRKQAEAGKVKEQDLKAPIKNTTEKLDKYISNLRKDLREPFKNALDEAGDSLTLELKKDGTFNKKTLDALDALVKNMEEV